MSHQPPTNRTATNAKRTADKPSPAQPPSATSRNQKTAPKPKNYKTLISLLIEPKTLNPHLGSFRQIEKIAIAPHRPHHQNPPQPEKSAPPRPRHFPAHDIISPPARFHGERVYL